MIFDCFMFFNEFDQLEIRLSELDSVVDRFVLVEAKQTLARIEKPMFFGENRDRFAKYLHKIQYLPIMQLPQLAVDDELGRFKLEEFQRNAIARGLAACNPDPLDVVLISDVDEIPSREGVLEAADLLKTFDVVDFHMAAYYKWLDAEHPHRDDRWVGTVATKYLTLANVFPQQIRQGWGTGASWASWEGSEKYSFPINHSIHRAHVKKGGWHLTYMGGEKAELYKVVNFAHGAGNRNGDPNSVKPVLISKDSSEGLLPLTNSLRAKLNKCIDTFLRKDLPEIIMTHIDDYYHLFKLSYEKISPIDVRLAYKFYLGRDAEDDIAVEAHARRCRTFDDLRSASYNSEEVKRARHVVGSPAGEFVSIRRNAPLVVIVGNCQAPNVGRIIASRAEVSVVAFEVALVATKRRQLVEILKHADIIFSPHMKNDLSEFSADYLAAHMDAEVRSYVPLYFRGMHPDLIYLGSRGERVQSPIGDYHSSVIFQSFNDGITRYECTQRFLAQITSLGIEEIFESSRKEFLRREDLSDIKIGDWFFDNIRRIPLLYSVNHPTVAVLERTASQFCRSVGIKFKDDRQTILMNALACGSVWPIYGVVRDVLQVEYGSDEVFWANSQLMLTLEEMIWRSYELYARLSKAEFSALWSSNAPPEV